MSASGNWYNELGSQMQVHVSGGDIWGWYYTAVGHAHGIYPLEGRINPHPYTYSGGMSQVLGWTVAWNNAYLNAYSATAWSGQYQTIDSDEEIIAFWLLTKETQPNEDWNATQVGKDVFSRNPPSKEEVKRNRKRIAKSHPFDEDT